MARGGRERRIGQEIQRILPELMRHDLKDPRVTGLITITAVEVTRDLKHSKVFVTRLGDAGALEEALAGLNSSSSFLRGALAQRMRLRSVPELTFVFDSSVERGVHLTRLIGEAMASSPEDSTSDAPRDS